MSPLTLEERVAEEVRSVDTLSVADLVSRVCRACPEASFREVHDALDRALAVGTVVVDRKSFMLRAPGR